MKGFLNASLAGVILTTGLSLTVPAVAQDRRNPDQRNMDQRDQNQRNQGQRNQDEHNQDQRDQRNQVQRYHDQRRNVDHDWNDHEQAAYRIWLKNHHRNDMDFSRLNAKDQQNYWNWRHSHSDAKLKINIR